MILFDGISLTILGIVAGVLILTGWVHQIIKGYRTKSLTDVSKYLMILIGIGAILWLIYGLEISDPYIIGTNIAAIILMSIIFIMKKKYDTKKNNA
jgi:MtN3 and saliva related transmembrane protein